MFESSREAEISRVTSIQSWVERSLPRGSAYALSLLGVRDVAEDIVHDCFCRLLAKLDVYDLPKDGFKLLLRSITNASIDFQRKAGSGTCSLDSQDLGSSPGTPADKRFSNPPDAAMQRELEAAIESALEGLPLKQRAALELKSLGCTLAEIAESLDVTESNAGVLVHRARRNMATELEPLLLVFAWPMVTRSGPDCGPPGFRWKPSVHWPCKAQ